MKHFSIIQLHSQLLHILDWLLMRFMVDGNLKDRKWSQISRGGPNYISLGRGRECRHKLMVRGASGISPLLSTCANGGFLPLSGWGTRLQWHSQSKVSAQLQCCLPPAYVEHGENILVQFWVIRNCSHTISNGFKCRERQYSCILHRSS